MNATATTTNMEAIVNKVRKLLRLAEEGRNSSEEERGAAMEAAMRFMQQHNLDHAAMFSSVNDGPVETVTNKVTGFRTEPWVRGLACAVADLCYTAIYYHGDKIVFVGLPTNIAASVSMMEWLKDSIQKESNRAYKDAHYRKSFRLGAARRLQERTRKMVEQEKVQESAAAAVTPTSSHTEENSALPATAGFGLVVLRKNLDTDNTAFTDKLGLRPFRSRGSRVSNDAYGSGKNFGDGISLNRQVGGGNVKRIGG